MTNQKFVSIIIPCRNEEKFIGRCLDSIIANDYPKDKIEVIVVDGMSTDGTREIIGRYIQKYPFIKLIINEKKITPCAFNLGIKNSKGEVIIIMGAHATYQNDYVSKCIRYLYEYDADNVGGQMVTLPQNDTFVNRAIVNVLTNRFGVGNSDFRTGTKQPKETDTVFGGCYRKEVFSKIGLFNENLVRSQDMEFNLRLKRAGYKTLLVPDITVYYYTRSTLKEVFNHRFKDGIWAVVPFKYSEIVPVRLRHLIPLFFVVGLFGSLILSFFIPLFFCLFLLVAISYLLANLYFSGKIASKEKNLKYFFVMPFIFVTLHISYGLGSVVGLVKVLFSENFWKMRIKKG